MKYKLLPFLAAVYLSSGAFASEELSTQRGIFDGWPVSNYAENLVKMKPIRLKYGILECGFMASDYRDRLILECFDPKCLSSPSSQATYRFNVDSVGKIHWQLVAQQQASDSDLFYCEQAFAESSPMDCFPASEDSLTFTRNSAPNASSFKASQDRVFMHFVPSSVERAYHDLKFFNERDIACDQNVVSISKSKITSSELKDFRDEWSNFIIANRHPRDRQVIVDFAKRLRLKYSNLFE